MSETQPARLRLLVLDDEKTKQILRRSDIIQAFPFLRGFAERVSAAESQNKTCRPCNGKKVLNTGDYSQVRRLLDRLTLPEKKKLCELLNAEAVRFYYLDESGRRVRATLPSI